MFAHRLSRTIAVAVALAADAAPAAARARGRSRAGTRLPHDFQSADTRDAVVPMHNGSATTVVPRGLYEPMRPENQPQPRQDLRSPDTVDFANGRGTYNSPEVVVVDVPKPESAPVSAGGIDWADAGLGAGSLLAITPDRPWRRAVHRAPPRHPPRRRLKRLNRPPRGDPWRPRARCRARPSRSGAAAARRPR